MRLKVRERKREKKRCKEQKQPRATTTTHIAISPGFLFGRGLPLSTPTYDTSSRLGCACEGPPGDDVGRPLPLRARGRRGELGAIEALKKLSLSLVLALVFSGAQFLEAGWVRNRNVSDDTQTERHSSS